MANIHHLHLNYINPRYHQRILDDPRILKISVGPYSKFRHGYSSPSFVVGGVDLHEVALEAVKELPPQRDANAIIVRDDHPEFAWLMLQVQQDPVI